MGDPCDLCGGSGRLYSDAGPAPRSIGCWECDGLGHGPIDHEDTDEGCPFVEENRRAA